HLGHKMDAATRLIVMCCFLLTGEFLTRALADSPGGRRSNGNEPNKNSQQVSEVNFVGQGQPATFICSAVSSKAMNVSWTHNGTLLQVAPGTHGDEATGTTGVFTVITRHEPLKSPPGGVLQTLTRSQLRLRRVSLHDAGVYGCEFSDHHGIFSRSSRLIVKPMNVTVETCLEGRSCLGAHKLCNVSTLRCQCLPGYSISQRDPAVCVPEFRLVSWLIWVAASAAVIAAILVAAKVAALILKKRNYRRGNLLSVTDDSAVLEEDGNDGGDHIQGAYILADSVFRVVTSPTIVAEPQLRWPSNLTSRYLGPQLLPEKRCTALKHAQLGRWTTSLLRCRAQQRMYGAPDMDGARSWRRQGHHVVLKPLAQDAAPGGGTSGIDATPSNGANLKDWRR
ncbi:hypothetical protein HPB47_019002, partial [Ixodes persulcatus]